MVSNCIREPRRWESAAVNSLHPGLLSPPAPCWGSVVPVVTVSADFKGFADTQGVSYDISLHNRGGVPKLSLLENRRCSRRTVATVLCFLSLVLVELNRQLSSPPAAHQLPDPVLTEILCRGARLSRAAQTSAGWGCLFQRVTSEALAAESSSSSVVTTDKRQVKV